MDLAGIANGNSVNWSGDESTSSLEMAYAESGLCATLSESCVELNIVALPPILTEEVTICAGESITIQNEEFSESGEYTIVDLTNSVVASGTCSESCELGTGLSSGMYYVTLENEQGTRTMKLVKK